MFVCLCVVTTFSVYSMCINVNKRGKEKKYFKLLNLTPPPPVYLSIPSSVIPLILKIQAESGAYGPSLSLIDTVPIRTVMLTG